MLTLWKSLVLPIFDYCSQLYNPFKVGEIQQLEMVQRSFIRKINGMHGLTYWEQLQRLKLFSLERRRERYRIIYIWKILERIVPNFTEQNDGIEVLHSDRRGRTCFQPAVQRSPYQELRNASLAVQGVKLFNSIPKYLRNLTGCSKEKFKYSLNKFLCQVPDEPQIPGYTACRRTESNSLLKMVKFVEQKDAKVSSIATKWWRSEDLGQGE